jgi:hypothetical protein
VKSDLDHDLLHVRYEPSKLAPEAMLQAVGKQGFQGKIVSAAGKGPLP